MTVPVRQFVRRGGGTKSRVDIDHPRATSRAVPARTRPDTYVLGDGIFSSINSKPLPKVTDILEFDMEQATMFMFH